MQLPKITQVIHKLHSEKSCRDSITLQFERTFSLDIGLYVMRF